MKTPDSALSIVLLVVTALVVVVAWPKYMSYVYEEKMNREDTRVMREMRRAEWINEALKDKPYYLEWKKQESVSR